MTDLIGGWNTKFEKCVCGKASWEGFPGNIITVFLQEILGQYAVSATDTVTRRQERTPWLPQCKKRYPIDITCGGGASDQEGGRAVGRHSKQDLHAKPK